MIPEGKWIKFELKEQKPKTQVWNIISKEDDIVLGYIAWYPHWRKYAFSQTTIWYLRKLV